jgi:hypothetical protein
VTPRTRLRGLSLIPALYALFGLGIIAATVPFRHFWSPVPGYAAGAAILLVAMVTTRELWLARSRAPLGLLMSGVVTLAVLLLLNRIFPFVEASSEPPSLIARAWYPTVLGFTAVFTLTSPWIAHASLRRAA